MKARPFPIALVLLVVLLSGAAQAGVVIKGKETDPESGPSATTVYLETDRVRVVTGTTEMIFRDDLQVMWIIQRDRKSYSELNREEMEQMKQQMTGAMDQAKREMEAAMKDMPPEQRKMMEQMASRMPQQPAMNQKIERTFRKTSKGNRVGNWTCDTYEVYKEEEKVEETCAAPLDQVRLTPADLGGLHKLAEFLSSLTGVVQSDFSNPAEVKQALGYEGFPVRTVSESGMGKHVWELESIEKASIPGATFEVPAGFKKVALEKMQED